MVERGFANFDSSCGLEDVETGCEVLKTPLLVDLRNIYRKEEVRQHGFVYVSVGRPAEDYLSPVRVGLKVAGLYASVVSPPRFKNKIFVGDR